MASKVVIKKEKVANVAGPSNAASESVTDVEGTQARILELTRELMSLTQEAIDSDPVISKISKVDLLNIMNPLLSRVTISMKKITIRWH